MEVKLQTENFIILGNGLNSRLCPKGFSCVDMPGHRPDLWDEKFYSMESLIEFYIQKIPYGATLWGHSLGGHIALNIGVARSDLNIINFGMTPINGPEDFGVTMTPVAEFAGFQKVDRTEEDMKGFLNYSSLGDSKILRQLLNCANEQDPNFNTVFFTTGLANYQWNEVEKVKSLGSRFNLILSENEALYNFSKVFELSIPIIEDNYRGHTPWLVDHNWTERIQEKLLLKKALSFRGEEKAFSSLSNQ